MNALKTGIILFALACVSMSFVSKDYKISIDLEKSAVSWTGKKVVGEHSGNIKIKSGHVVLTDGKLSGGEFVMDMNTIETTDMKGKMADKLDGHLMSADFFDVEKFPEAKFVASSVEAAAGLGNYTVKGDLTIKGQTHPVNFTAVQSDSDVSGRMMIDRTLYGIQYGSGSFFDNLGDKAIDNEFALDFRAVFVFE